MKKPKLEIIKSKTRGKWVVICRRPGYNEVKYFKSEKEAEVYFNYKKRGKWGRG